jgi:hypothetical protein
MKIGYYVSMHAEILENPVIPKCRDILDAYKTPILLLRAKNNGLLVPPYIVSDNAKDIEFEIGFPMLIFPVNPFSNGSYRIVHSEGSLYRTMNSLSMNHKYPICAESLNGPIYAIKVLFGCVKYPLLMEMASKIFCDFRLPVFQLIVQIINGKPYLCGLVPLCAEDVNLSDLEFLSTKVEEAEIRVG